MDASRFDELVARLVDGPSRRDALRGLIGGALASIGIGAAATDNAEAQKGKGKGRSGNGKNNDDDNDNEVTADKKGNKNKKRKKQCRRKKQQACDGGRCGTVTVRCKKGKGKKAKKKRIDCGPCVCEPACEGGECCDQGTCVAECPEGQICIDGTCGVAECTVCETGCPFTSVQDAIDDAEADDTITICAGTFTENLTIDKNLTIVGAGTEETILDGNDAGSVVTIAAGLTAVEFENLTISNGTSAGVGGGISNDTAQTTLRGVLITGNVATTRGGGIDINGGGNVTLIDCQVTDNVAGTDGGGIFALGVLSLEDGSSVTENEAAGSGGGIAIGDVGTVTIDDTSSVTDNHADVDGGGVHNLGDITCADPGTVTNNTAGDPMPAANNCIDDGTGTGCDTCNEV